MLFNEYGEASGKVIVMLAGSFCTGQILDCLYTKLNGYRIVVPTYNGHYKGSKDFASHAGEAAEICTYIDWRRSSVRVSPAPRLCAAAAAPR